MKALEREEEEMKELVQQKQDHQVMSAAQKKEARLLQESLVRILRNSFNQGQLQMKLLLFFFVFFQMDIEA